jgi:hypothetical protein
MSTAAAVVAVAGAATSKPVRKALKRARNARAGALVNSCRESNGASHAAFAGGLSG